MKNFLTAFNWVSQILGVGFMNMISKIFLNLLIKETLENAIILKEKKLDKDCLLVTNWLIK